MACAGASDRVLQVPAVAAAARLRRGPAHHLANSYILAWGTLLGTEKPNRSSNRHRLT